MRKISARTREAAITICLLRADDPSWPAGWAGHMIGASWRAIDLAIDAHAQVTGDVANAGHLEAAALLRDGWCPGDPVVRL